MNHIELFAGCGGLSLGLETAGFKLLLANELSPMASETFAYNHLNVDLESDADPKKIYWISSQHDRGSIKKRLRENPLGAIGLKGKKSDLLELKPKPKDLERSLLIGSIVDLNSILGASQNKNLLKSLRTGLGTGGVDLVSGGPPCQSFSMAGLRNLNSERNQLPWEFAKFVEKVQPKIALLENVSGILRAFKDGDKTYHAWFEVAIAFAKVGYIPICLHVNAKYVGAAQNRPRFILIALREDIGKAIKQKCSYKVLSNALEVSSRFYRKVKAHAEPKYGSLPYYDIEKHPDFFESPVFSSLSELRNKKLVSVKSAIDDLRSKQVKESEYVRNINSIYEKHHNHKDDKQKNNALRGNNRKVKSRFRIYQIMTKLPSDCSKEVSEFLRNKDSSVVSNTTITELGRYKLLETDGSVVQYSSRREIIALLSKLHTKKRTQKALLQNDPAPAALSIPDDACHYHENVQRTLTVREMARIQSFPDWYEIKSKVTTGGQMRKFEVPQYTQIGNAVPPLLGIALGKVCKTLLEILQK